MYIVKHPHDEQMMTRFFIPMCNGNNNNAHQVEGAIHTFLSDGPAYRSSTFMGDAFTPGQVVNGVRHEDLQQLSFPDDSFDLVLSAEVCVWGGGGVVHPYLGCKHPSLFIMGRCYAHKHAMQKQTNCIHTYAKTYRLHS